MTKYAGRGLVLSIGTSAIGQVTAIGPIGSSRDLIDASAYGDDWKDYVLGQQDGNEVAVTVAYDPIDTQHLALIAAYEAATTTTFELEHVDSAFYATFYAIVTALSRGGDIGGLLSMDVTLKIVEPGVTEGT